MRIAWIGAAPDEGGGAPEVGLLLIEGLLDRGHMIDCYVTGHASVIPPRLAGRDRFRVVGSGGSWSWGRWYSRNELSSLASGLLARALGQRRLCRLMLAGHATRPYDVVYQYSNIEMFGIQRHLDRLPPVVLHPETHIAGELRWYRREADLRRRCQPWWRSALVRPLLEMRTWRQRRHAALGARVICISESFRSLLITDYGIDPARTALIPNPVDLEEFPLDDHAPGVPLTGLFVGRVSVRKGIEQVIELSHRLADLEGKVVLKIIGGHTLWSDYRPLLSGLHPGMTEVVGHLSTRDLAKQLSQADFLVQPSKYEPFGLTVAEALASGTPVVVSEAVGAADFVSGAAVSTVAVEDTDALERAVRMMLDRIGREGPQLRRSARAEAERAFAPDAVVAMVERVLRQAIGAATGNA